MEWQSSSRCSQCRWSANRSPVAHHTSETFAMDGSSWEDLWHCPCTRQNNGYMDLKSLGALLAEEFHDVLCRHKPRTAHSALEAFVELSGDSLVHCGVAWRRCGPCSVFTMSATPGQSRPSEGCRSFRMWDIVRCSIGESAGRLLRSPFSESKWNEDFAEV